MEISVINQDILFNNPELLERVYRAAKSVAIRKGENDWDASDIAQETSIRVWIAATRGVTWPDEAPLFRYAFRSADRIIIDKWRMKNRRPDVFSVTDFIADPKETEEIAINNAQLSLVYTIIKEAVRSKNGHNKNDLETYQIGLAYLLSVSGWTNNEVAETVGMRLSTVYSHLIEFREELRRIVGDCE